MAISDPYPVIDMKKTGENIKRLREERGISVVGVQNYLGLESPQSIYAWQKGATIPSVDHLCALSVLLDVSMHDILILVEPIKREGSARSCIAGATLNGSKTILLFAAA